MRKSRSPLLLLTLIGASLGALYGAYSYRPTQPEEVVDDGDYYQEQREGMRWWLRRKADPEDANKIKYELEETPFTYTVSVNRRRDGEDNEFAWKDLLDRLIWRGDTTGALELSASIADAAARQEAISLILSTLSSRTPNFSDDDQTQLDDTETKESPEDQESARQRILKEFASQTEQHVSTCLELIDGLPDAHKIPLLIGVSDIQESLDLKDAASNSLMNAKKAFHSTQAAQTSVWATTKSVCSTVFGWAGAIGLTTLFTGLFVQVIGFYIVETLAAKVGDERFAKALGTTVKTTISESGLILPERLQRLQREQD